MKEVKLNDNCLEGTNPDRYYVLDTEEGKLYQLFLDKEYKDMEKLISSGVEFNFLPWFKGLTKDQAIKYLRYRSIKWKTP